MKKVRRRGCPVDVRGLGSSCLQSQESEVALELIISGRGKFASQVIVDNLVSYEIVGKFVVSRQQVVVGNIVGRQCVVR